MKRKPQFTALLLALSLILSLAACGDKSKNGQQNSGVVYVPETLELKMDNIDYINQGCVSGDNLFFVADVRGEEKTETWTDPDTGETEEYTYYDMRTGLFRVPLTGGAVQELDNYAMPDVPEGSDGNIYIDTVQIGENGTIWVTEDMTVFHYDFPEGFDPEENPDEKWEYQTDYEDTIIRRQLDETGKELDRMDMTALEEKAGVEYIGSTVFDQAGNIYFTSDNKVIGLDKDLNKILELTLEEEAYGNLIPLGDGSMGLRASYHTDDNYGYQMRVIDLANQTWGETMELSQNAYNAFSGGGDYLFYYQNNDSVYGWKKGAAEGEKIFSWLGAGLNRSDVDFYCFLDDGRVAAVSQYWEEEGIRGELTILTPTDAKTLPEKKTITLASMWVGYDVRNRVMEFNQESDTCRIEVVDYGEYNTGADNTAGLTKLNTEIAAGHVPDIFYTDDLPMNRYAAKGILEDLWPYIEADTGIGGRQALMEHVLDAASIDGKLYTVFSTFSMQSVVGPASIVGDRMSWTLADLQTALASMPEGCTIFGEDDIKEYMLENVMSMNLSSFVDWNTGTCSFDSDNFKALLEFCNSFPAEYNWEDHMDDEYESPYTRMLNGKQLLSTAYLYDFTRDQLYNQLFEGGCSYVGYPREDGSVGSCFYANGAAFAMSSSCADKDAAWSFIRELLLPQADEEHKDYWGQRYYFNGYPVNKSDFEKYRDSQMTEIYEMDENDQPVLDEDGQPVKIATDSWYITDDLRIECYAATQEDVDRTMALYNAIDSFNSYDQSIFSIIEDVTGAYFAGDLDTAAAASRIQDRVQLYVGENM
ncbi:MAG: extracellular solute-binding protein [Oscillospiraceae bacterium]|nr:extracellular solute-binding protein [Oscillospiraceae bacterium]